MPSIGAYTTTHNCIQMAYPFEVCIRSLLGFADEVVVVDGGSTDGTWERLQNLSKLDSRVKISQELVDWEHPRWAVLSDGIQKGKARARCTAEYLWQVDVDEIVPDYDFPRIKALPEALSEVWQTYPVVFMPMTEFWGSFDRIRADFLSWKPRISINDPRIGHGIPLEFRMVDSDGYEYPRPYESDSCNYIYKDTKESVPMLFPIDVPSLNPEPEVFQKFFSDSLDRFPGVLHVSWLDLRRKIEHYRNYWVRFHRSMYNLTYPDIASNNTMFQKRWCEVTDEDADNKVYELKASGPRFFHRKSGEQSNGYTLMYQGEIPAELTQWAKENCNL